MALMLWLIYIPLTIPAMLFDDSSNYYKLKTFMGRFETQQNRYLFVTCHHQTNYGVEKLFLRN